jgi:hypothetical protein
LADKVGALLAPPDSEVVSDDDRARVGLPVGARSTCINSLTLRWNFIGRYGLTLPAFELLIKTLSCDRILTFNFFNVDHSMEDSAHARSSVKSFDEKKPFEDVVAPTWTTSAANLIRFLSQKLLTWGVEARGAYHVSNPKLHRPDQRAPCGILRTAFARLTLDRYPSCRRRG